VAVLSQAPTHGYVLVQRVAELDLFAGGAPDPSGVYRTLKDMEREGLVTSAWETGGQAAFPDRVGGFIHVYVTAPLAGAAVASQVFTRLLEPQALNRSTTCSAPAAHEEAEV
jgi:hypothetical protein